MLWAELCVPQIQVSRFWLPAPEGVALFRDETLMGVIRCNKAIKVGTNPV